MNKLDFPYANVQRWGLIAGIAGVVLLVVALLLSGPEVFFRYYLVAFLFALDVSMGALILATLHYLTGGDWGFVIHQPLQAASQTLWVVALAFLPLLFGLSYLYPWAVPELVAQSAVLQHKTPYLNVPFFIIRAVIYFAIWLLYVFLVRRWAGEIRTAFDPGYRRPFQRVAAIGLILFTLTMTFAATDWIMSIEEEWFSTAFGFLIVSGQVLGGLALSLALLPWLDRERSLSEFIAARTVRDLGAILLSAVIFWAYIAFSQFLIIWYGNLPRESIWYLERSNGGWIWVGLLVIVVQFVLPFLVLLSLRAKRNPRLLTGLAAGILVARLLDYYWQVIPGFYPQGITFHWALLAALLAIGGFWAAVFARNLAVTRPALPPQGIATPTSAAEAQYDEAPPM